MQTRQAKATFVALFVVVALLVHATAVGWAIAAFGILNVLLTHPGTGAVRLLTAIVSLAALAAPREEIQLVFVAVIWLIWPPAFMMAWGIGTSRTDGLQISRMRPRATLAAVIAAVAVGSMAFRLIAGGPLQQTAALFVGIPALLAIVVVLAVSPRSAVGVACKAVTVGLLVSVVFLGEGFLCVAMSAPIFYLVAIGIAKSASSLRQRRDTGASTFSPWMLLMLTLPFSLEGTTPFTTMSRDESVSESRIVNASAQDIRRSLVQAPRFGRPLPIYLRAGFPRPASVQIDTVRGLWSIQMRGGETRLNGTEPKAGDLILKLEEERPGIVRWRAVSDTSHMTHFLTWQEMVVTWEPVSDRTSRVTWTLRYRRGLDPAWYFGPMERYAVRLAAGYLIDSVATP